MDTPHRSTPEDDAQRDRRAKVEKLFLNHSPALKGFIHALIRDRELSEDVLQETFLTVSAKADSFTPGSNFMAWACAIARFKVLEAIRKRSKQHVSLSADVIEQLAAEFEEPNTDREVALKQLECCIDKLPQRSKALIDLRYFNDNPPEAIAQRLSLRLESVYVSLSRARTLLRDCLERNLSKAR